MEAIDSLYLTDDIFQYHLQIRSMNELTWKLPYQQLTSTSTWTRALASFPDNDHHHGDKQTYLSRVLCTPVPSVSRHTVVGDEQVANDGEWFKRGKNKTPKARFVWTGQIEIEAGAAGYDSLVLTHHYGLASNVRMLNNVILYLLINGRRARIRRMMLGWTPLGRTTWRRFYTVRCNTWEDVQIEGCTPVDSVRHLYFLFVFKIRVTPEHLDTSCILSSNAFGPWNSNSLSTIVWIWRSMPVKWVKYRALSDANVQQDFVRRSTQHIHLGAWE